MNIWTIYWNPKDYPSQFVARRFVFETPTNDMFTAETLNEVRALLPHGQGLYRIPRNEYDDPCVVEVWL